ncbi:MAG TPA: DHH family phosphoesterase, partial [Phycisphaerae bacterium]|nr:DHH family phosphoesterase [Phycisphaerae bacterium]
MERTNPSGGRERRPTPEFIAAFKALRHPLMLGHVTPDADSLGACLALAAACGENGLPAAVGLPAGCVSERLGFMLQLAGATPRVEAATAEFDAAVVIDAASEKRINCGTTITIPGGTPAFNIDHHITNTDFARHNWVDPHASSSCEMIARFIGELGWRISPTVASLLYS